MRPAGKRVGPEDPADISQDGAMFRCSCTFISAALLALGVPENQTFADADRAAAAGPSAANGPVALSVDQEQAGESVAGQSPSGDAAAAAATERSAHDEGDPAASNNAIDSLEAKSLGRPNGPLSARPVDEQHGSGSDAISRFDPRRNEIVRIVGAVAVVVGLLVLLRVVLKRVAGGLAAGGRPAGVLEILARYPVGRGQALMLLKMGRRIVLVHHAGTAMRALSEVTNQDEVAALLARMEAGARARDAGRFRSVLRAFEREHEQGSGAEPSPYATGGGSGVEVVDLTRAHGRGFASLFGRRRGAA
jgi:flagellar biogenesis protein FliO